MIPRSSSVMVVYDDDDTNSGGGCVGLEEGAEERFRMHVGGCDRALQALMQVCIVYVCMCVRACVFMCVYIYICVFPAYTFIYTYIHICMCTNRDPGMISH